MTMPQRPIPVAAEGETQDTEGHRYARGADAERAEGETQDTEGHRYTRGADAERAEGETQDAEGHVIRN